MKQFLLKLLNWNIPSKDGIFPKISRKNLETIFVKNKFQSFSHNYGDKLVKTYTSTIKQINNIKINLIENYNFQFMSDAKILFYEIENNIYVVFSEELILLNYIKSDKFLDFVINNLKLSKSNAQKYIFDLSSLNTTIKAYQIKHRLESKYKLIHVQKNALIINDHFESTHFIYGEHNPTMYQLPDNCKTIIYQIEFYTNSNNELVEVKVISNNKNHPNIDYRKNKYCIGNFRFKQLNTNIIQNIIDNIKIYNLISSYNIPKNLKNHIDKTIRNNNKIDLNFL